MSGFGLYETLRILVPGLMGVLFLNLAARLGFGPSSFEADGAAAGFTEALQNPVTSLVVALGIGLILYLVDLPTSTALYKGGDPDDGAPLPSRHLSGMLDKPLKDRAISVYFVLADKFLPIELHRRVYLFGSLYRVYVDMRALSGLALVGAVLMGLIEARPVPPIGFQRTSMWPTLVIVVVAWLLVAMIGLRRHAVSFRRARIRKGEDRTFAADLRVKVHEIQWVCLLVVLVNGIAVISATVFDLPFWLGGSLTLIGLGMWIALEVGPPESGDLSGWRSLWLRRLGAEGGHTRFSSVQRLALDLATFVPWLLAAGSLTADLGRPGSAVGWFAVFLIPIIATSTFPKHEIRLVAAFKDQVTWLDLHASEIQEIKKSGSMPDRWWPEARNPESDEASPQV